VIAVAKACESAAAQDGERAYIYPVRQESREPFESTEINCWHINEYESAATWKLYSQIGNGKATSKRAVSP
jgi:hypothetical protein